MSTGIPDVSFVIPVHNGEQYLEAAIRAVLSQRTDGALELLLVDDGGRDGSAAIIRQFESDPRVRVVAGPRKGAAAALNEGIRHARYPIICQVDQDVILQPGWLDELLEALRDPSVAAAQGYYVTPPDGSLWSRLMGLDLEDRYASLSDRAVDHVCTGNTAYRADALQAVGLFDETLGYGYDNDMSYRLVEAGHRLVIRPRARSIHRWRESWWGYLVQQYGFGYGRIDLIAKHRGSRFKGDDVSGLMMMMHAPIMAVGLAAMVMGVVLSALGLSGAILAAVGAAICLGLALERLVAGIRVTLRHRDPAGLLFLPAHLARDLAWIAAMVLWSLRSIRGVRSLPADSMHPRPATRGLAGRRTS